MNSLILSSLAVDLLKLRQGWRLERKLEIFYFLLLSFGLVNSLDIDIAETENRFSKQTLDLIKAVLYIVLSPDLNPLHICHF